jgi:hypothetical protein
MELNGYLVSDNFFKISLSREERSVKIDDIKKNIE